MKVQAITKGIKNMTEIVKCQPLLPSVSKPQPKPVQLTLKFPRSKPKQVQLTLRFPKADNTGKKLDKLA